jgi:hypothetical protein
MQDKVTIWDRLTYHNRFSDRLMRASGMKNWRRDKRQMIPFAVSVKCSLILGTMAAFYAIFLLWLFGQFWSLSFPLGVMLMCGFMSFALTAVMQFVSNCGWNARAMKLHSQPKTRTPYTDAPLPELPEILR